MASVSLALMWHQHQPYYPDDVAGENPMPWVRLHATKDYLGMALHLEEVPEFRCTINLVPSLLTQLESYVEGATDTHLTMSRRPVDGLEHDDACYLMDNFFMAFADSMIRPHARYHELYMLRAAWAGPAEQALKRFRPRDLRDLQVWSNLAWIHPLLFEKDAELAEFKAKGRHYTEDEKQWLLDKQRELLARVIPLHRALAERGQIELTTTPYYHPILPLLLDQKLAREAMPDVALPAYREGYPEDAEIHVRRGVESHLRRFGAPPRGMWPSEGSVCQALIPLLARHGIEWIATDEEILGCSTGARSGGIAAATCAIPSFCTAPGSCARANRTSGCAPAHSHAGEEASLLLWTRYGSTPTRCARKSTRVVVNRDPSPPSRPSRPTPFPAVRSVDATDVAPASGD